MFIGPPEHMDVVLSQSEWIKDILSFDLSDMDVVFRRFYEYIMNSRPYSLGDGSEGVLLGWINWRRVPIGIIRFDDKGHGPYFGILRQSIIGEYCKGNFAKSAFWTDAVCLLGSCVDSKPPHPRGADYLSHAALVTIKELRNELRTVCPNGTLDALWNKPLNRLYPNANRHHNRPLSKPSSSQR